MAPADPDLAAAVANAYAATRRLYDELDVALAIWRGDTMYSESSGHLEEVDMSRSATWNRLDGQVDSAYTALYRVEGLAPNSQSAQTARQLSQQLTATLASVSRVAEARQLSRIAESEPSKSTESIESSRSQERSATDQLIGDRQRLGELVGELSAPT